MARSLWGVALILLIVALFYIFSVPPKNTTRQDQKTMEIKQQPSTPNIPKDVTQKSNDKERKNFSSNDVQININTNSTNYRMSQYIVWQKVFARINNDISILEKETTADSLINLKNVSLYYWPGAQRVVSYEQQLPLGKEIGRFDVETIMSNRRFLKLYNELRQLDRGNASTIVNAEIEKALTEYKILYDQLCKANESKYPAALARDKPTLGLSFQIQNGNEKSTLFLGARFRVLSLIFLAAQLQLYGSHSKILEAVELAIDQRDQVYNDHAHHIIYKTDLLIHASLYSRQILATASYLTSPKKTAAFPKLIEKKLTPYNAELTPYDQPSMIGALPVDYSRGIFNLRFLASMDDKEFKETIDQYR